MSYKHEQTLVEQKATSLRKLKVYTNKSYYFYFVFLFILALAKANFSS